MRLMSSTSWEGIFTTIRNLFHTFMFYILKSTYLYRSRGWGLIIFFSSLISTFLKNFPPPKCYLLKICHRFVKLTKSNIVLWLVENLPFFYITFTKVSFSVNASFAAIKRNFALIENFFLHVLEKRGPPFVLL